MTNRVIRFALRGFCLLCPVTLMVGSTVATQKPVERIKLYVFTAAPPAGLRLDPNLQASADELKRDLSSSKSLAVQIVSAKEGSAGADVTLLVLACGSKRPGSTSVAVNLSSGAFSTLIEGTSYTTPNMTVGYDVICRRAANDAAKEIEKWIRANYDLLVSGSFDVPLASEAHAACTPDMRTPHCREAVAKSVEARIRKAAPAVEISVVGTDNETLVFKWPELLDDPKIRTTEEHEKESGNFCKYGFKGVIVLGVSVASRYEFDLNCPAANRATGPQ
jgi:hypothetical protein